MIVKHSITLLLIIALTGLAFVGFNDAVMSPEKLGEKLFNEKILSKDSSVSCASCHKPEFAFADTMAFSIGIHQIPTKRNTPSVLNMKERPYFFWDGRVESLAEQALMPIQNPDEMGLPIEEAVARLNSTPYYVEAFKKTFHTAPNRENLSKALAAFENTLETVDSKFDDWSNNIRKLSPSEERGRQVFLSDKAKCFDCHLQIDFTNDDFKNIGLFNGTSLNDSGRMAITHDPEDLGKFKTPGLRNVAVTAPYMHNGMFRTLEEVVEYYNDPRKVLPDGKNIDPALNKPLGLTNREKRT